jgi:hypothetical protein
VLTAVGLVSCGGSGTTHRRQHPAAVAKRQPLELLATGDPRARIPRAQSVAMAGTPPALLAICRRNKLLRPLCPRLGPAANRPHTWLRPLGYCSDRTGRDLVVNGHFERLAGGRCVDAGWGYEQSAPLAGFTRGRLHAWDGRHWFVPAYAPMEAPPWHIHVEIQASRGSAPIGVRSSTPWPEGAHQVTDALLNPNRARSVSLGWVRWHGKRGQLVMAPTNLNGGEWAGHMVFVFTNGSVGCAVTLHAWTSRERIDDGRTHRLVTFTRGPALPHVIATLRRIVDSMG